MESCEGGQHERACEQASEQAFERAPDETAQRSRVRGVPRRCPGLVFIAALGTSATVAFAQPQSQSAASPSIEQVRFGGDHVYPPLQWLEAGEPRGFVIELSDAIAAQHGARAVHVLGTWPDTMRALADGDIDVLAMFESTSREREFIFVAPFLLTSHGIYTRDDPVALTAIGDLEGTAVAVEELSFAFDQLQSWTPGVRLIAASDTYDALRRVAAGQADYAVLAALPANNLIARHDFAIRQVGPSLWPRSYGFAVRRDRPALAAWIEDGLNALYESGEYHALHARWSRQLTEPQSPPSAFAVPIIVGVALATGLLAVFAWVRHLRQAVSTYSSRAANASNERDVAESRKQWVSDHDVYTELPRLHRFIARVNEVRDKHPGRPLCVVALRLVELEQTVRAYGHDAGIQLASDMAQRLRAMSFDAYGLSGRDVFLVCGDPQFAEARLRVSGSAADTLVLPIGGLPETIAGCAVASVDVDARELVRRAEAALGLAERSAEKWVEYRPAFDPGEADIQLVRLFRETSGEGLFAVFQPQVDIRSGEVVGAEALARWNAPGIGLVPPSRFIPLLEHAGLVRYVTRRMINESVRVAAELRRAGFDCPVSVNVAVSDLLGDGTRRTIFRAFQDHGASPSCLKVELTETSFAESAETVRWVMSRLRDSGLKLSIDDFGTGFSSLSYLSEFPIDEVKIDRSFILGIEHKARSRSIVRATIAMAHELGLLVVAEGVESDAAMRLLLGDGCDRAQGYLVSRPVAEEDLLPYLEHQHERTARVRRH